jgi:hypothetical protein
MSKSPLVIVLQCRPLENVGDGFVSKDANQKIFMGAGYGDSGRPYSGVR